MRAVFTEPDAYAMTKTSLEATHRTTSSSEALVEGGFEESSEFSPRANAQSRRYANDGGEASSSVPAVCMFGIQLSDGIFSEVVVGRGATDCAASRD
jgi:hypothetical protein